jgi:hypothetical protein
MNGFDRLATQFITAVADLNWKVAGVGDFNMDGNADILWRRDGNGANAMWQMNGFAVSAAQLIQGLPVAWQVEGIRDFNRDVKADILWRNAVTGQNFIWQMDGFALTTGQSIGAVPDTNWTILP